MNNTSAQLLHWANGIDEYMLRGESHWNEAALLQQKKDLIDAAAELTSLTEQLCAATAIVGPPDGKHDIIALVAGVSSPEHLRIALLKVREQRDEYKEDVARAFEMLRQAECPVRGCVDGMITNTGPDPQHDGCEWCYGRHMLLDANKGEPNEKKG